MEKTVIGIVKDINVVMPTKIVIGDPSYFDTVAEKLTLNKRFRGKKDWLSLIRIKEKKVFFKIDDDDYDIYSTEVEMFFAKNDKHLEVYKNNQYFKNQKSKMIEIGVDTARYIIETNIGSEEIYTASDGFFGQVIELYTGNKLDGIIVSLDIPEEAMTYEEALVCIGNLFQVK